MIGKHNKEHNNDFDPAKCVREVEKIIGYEYNDKNLLKRALTHSSYAVMCHSEAESYQRMEFLGDALLDFVVADALYRSYPEFDEGRMTKIRASVVSKTPLAHIIESSKIINYVMYDRKNTTLSEKLKSDIFESIVASIYLDSNSIRASKNFIMKYMKTLIAQEVQKDVLDYKSMIYEYGSKNNKKVECVEVKREGPAHDLTFFMELKIDGEVIATADGKSIREASQKCSKQAVIKLGVMDK